MEASSHGLDQSRLDGVKLAAAAFTNLGRDHMDYHPTIEDYMAAKMRLFDTLLPKGSPAVIFADDAWSEQAIKAAIDAGHNVRTVGRKGEYLTLKRVEHFRHKQVAEIHAEGQIFEVHIPLAGDFQVANALVAAGLAMSTGVPAKVAMAALEKLQGASGRLELVGHTKDGALAYVDYAHKPDALSNVLASVRPFTTGRVIVVFGCGGDRDRGKRPIMGEIACRLADVVIVTDDNPRSEVPAEIRAEIMAAAPGATEIADRAEAIREAVGMLTSGDTLIVAGKGHEEGQTIGCDAAVLGSCRTAQGLGGAEIVSWLWTTQDMIAAMAGRPFGTLPEGITGIAIDSRSIGRARLSSRSRATVSTVMTTRRWRWPMARLCSWSAKPVFRPWVG
jgi:UDP-N-acetylmuramoyl-L-alanyl-D-glutamate--2,6-diaminopimelate ligase